jgi:hypothetical protein
MPRFRSMFPVTVRAAPTIVAGAASDNRAISDAGSFGASSMTLPVSMSAVSV